MGNNYVLALQDRKLNLTGPMTLGRGRDCDIVFRDDPEVSRHHARVNIVTGGLELEDLNSTNGTFLGAKRIRGRQVLLPGESFRAGSNWLCVKRVAEPVHQACTIPTPALGTGQCPPSTQTRPTLLLSSLEELVRSKHDPDAFTLAEHACRAHLLRLFDEVQAGWRHRAHIDQGVKLACLLAQRAPHAQWLNYLVRLYSHLGEVMTPEVTNVLSLRGPKFPELDRDAVRAYQARIDDQLAPPNSTERVTAERLALLLSA